MNDHRMHRGNTPLRLYDLNWRHGLMLITCPVQFLHGCTPEDPGGAHPVLVRWKASGYPNNVIWCNSYLWIVSPDCEP